VTLDNNQYHQQWVFKQLNSVHNFQHHTYFVLLFVFDELWKNVIVSQRKDIYKQYTGLTGGTAIGLRVNILIATCEMIGCRNNRLSE
jgi:hypothetical protein